MDSTLLPFALLCFTSFFTLTNPLGTMPVFLTMTHGMTDKERQSIVRRATTVSYTHLRGGYQNGNPLSKRLIHRLKYEFENV